MRCVLVSHTHWDREWYRTFEQFRARLVDTIDRVLDLCTDDPAYRFLLDGQTIVLEDYAAIRPHRSAELAGRVREGRLAIGPWWIQPDSLIPSGEAHVRNLLEGRRVAEAWGPVSAIAYTPDSFGHPAHFPQLLAGFGLRAFVYWRGNGNEIDHLPSEFRWEAPDGSGIVACHLPLGYFVAAHLEADPEQAAARLERGARSLAARAAGEDVLLLAGVDHQMPDEHVDRVAEALTRRTGWPVTRGVLDDFVARIPDDLPVHRGELLGARVANLLPGVWSSRTYQKLASRTCEAILEGWAEPVTALGRRLGTADERPALRLAWRALLQNHAHDSIGGCSHDRVHAQMNARFDRARELGEETTTRTLERIAGASRRRETPWTTDLDLAVFNPMPWPQSGIARFPIDPVPAMKFDAVDLANVALHPLLLATTSRAGWIDADGRPARVVVSDEPGRFRLLEGSAAVDLELVVPEVPALGWRRVRLRPAAPSDDVLDHGRVIASGGITVASRDDGTFDVTIGGRRYAGLGALEDVGDVGDAYDCDPIGPQAIELVDTEHHRARHASGIAVLCSVRRIRIPARADLRARRRSEERATLTVTTEARVAPDVDRVDMRVRVDNAAHDHRLRLLVPTGAATQTVDAATTFGIAQRTPGRTADARDWVHPPPATFPHQGWIAVNGLGVGAPGLVEAEVTPAGTIALTLLRAVGNLARLTLATRPIPAGPTIPTPGAQCPGRLDARLALFAADAPWQARAAELGLRAVLAGEHPLVRAERPLLALAPRTLVLSALKPAEHVAGGFVVRVLNPSPQAVEAVIELGLPVERARAVRLDETPIDLPLALAGQTLRLPLPAHAMRSVLVT